MRVGPVLAESKCTLEGLQPRLVISICGGTQRIIMFMSILECAGKEIYGVSK